MHLSEGNFKNLRLYINEMHKYSRDEFHQTEYKNAYLYMYSRIHIRPETICPRSNFRRKDHDENFAERSYKPIRLYKRVTA